MDATVTKAQRFKRFYWRNRRTIMSVLTPIGWIVAAVCVAWFAFIWPMMRWHNGIYAGFHYGSAVGYVQGVMAENYGLDQAKLMRFAEPDNIKTHSKGGTLFGVKPNEQIRIFHLIGPRGVKYCVSVWNGGYNHAQDYKIVKGCSF